MDHCKTPFKKHILMDITICIFGYSVPAEAKLQEEPRYATLDEVMQSIAATRDQTQPVLDYLKDK